MRVITGKGRGMVINGGEVSDTNVNHGLNYVYYNIMLFRTSILG